MSDSISHSFCMGAATSCASKGTSDAQIRLPLEGSGVILSASASLHAYREDGSQSGVLCSIAQCSKNSA